MKIKSMYAMLLAVMTLAFAGCSKDDDNGPATDPVEVKGALKVTVTTSSSFDAANSEVSVSGSSSDANGKFQSWKVNGDAGPAGQILHTVDKEYFQGGATAILISPDTYLTASVNISAFTIDQDFTLSYKIEQGDKVLVDKTVEVKQQATPISLAFTY